MNQIHIFVITAIIAITMTSDRWWLFLFLLVFLLFCRKQMTIPLMVCIGLTYIFFTFYYPYYKELHSTSLSPQSTKQIGSISSLPVIDGDRLSFRFTLSSDEQIQFNYKIPNQRDQEAFKKLSLGMVCNVSGVLEQPIPARNFYSFDYQSYLRSYYGIHWVIRPSKFTIDQCQYRANFLNEMHRYRKKQMERIKRDFPEEISGMMNALLFGDRGGIEEELIDQYQSLGLIHLLAVSGLHVGTILGLLFFLLIRIGVTRDLALWILLSIIPFFIIMTGATPSVLRSGFMAALVCLVSLSRYKISPINQLSLVCLILLLIKPTYIFHLGFQLSFLITASLLLSSKIITNYKGMGGQLCAASIISQIISIPIIIWHFHEFSLWSLPLNMVMIPLVTIIVLPMVFLTFILYISIPGPVWVIFSNILEICFSIIHFVMNIADSLPFGLLTFGRPTTTMLFLLIISLLFFLIRWERSRTSHYMVTPSLIILIILLLIWVQPYLNKNAYITMLDVGQGDAIIIELPYRKAVYVIDTGGILEFKKEEWRKRKNSYNTGKDVVIPYLKARGIRKINALILTHGDKDHVGGTLNVIDGIPVESVYYGKSNNYDDEEIELLHQIQKRRVPIHYVHQGMEWKLDHHSFHILGPANNSTSKNNRSIILYFKLYEKSFLFMGDIEREGEDAMVKQFGNLNVDVLKVGHHGSETSSSQAFLDHVQPEIGLISVGVNNRYQHPSTKVIDRLKQNGVTIYRTDISGSIRMELTPSTTVVESMLESK
ncbi:DNA internalization-related competence protein ComEC/Rec2 [Pseudalkalibacillus decolorationis]|uniref:DNA internalization-related competence protein ComEC/Rec2 n=1 Tax=Pseudalkalibacillus decolorationis TaxID=163879 RepID=UPI002147F124|nr:DNA internalization-related competence protein ComEC/Rec2 [Pseudalkalibacillus decolorationis]